MSVSHAASTTAALLLILAAAAACSESQGSFGTSQGVQPLCPSTPEATIGARCAVPGLRCGPQYACGILQAFCAFARTASFNARTAPAASFGMEAGPCVQCLGRAARAHPPKEARSLRAATSRGCSAHIRALARRSSTSANASRARRPTEASVFASSASLPCAPGPKPVRRLSNPVTTEGRLIQPQKRAPIRAPIPTPTPAMTTAEKPTRSPAMLARTSRGRSLARRTR